MTRNTGISEQRASDAPSVLALSVTGGKTMPDGSNFMQSPALSVVTAIAPHLNGLETPAKRLPADTQASVVPLDKKERARRRRQREKKALEARRKELERVPSVPFRTAPLLSADYFARPLTPEGLELQWRGAIRAVWDLGPKASLASRDKAARDYLARQQLLPAEINALARILTDFNRGQARWGSLEYYAKCHWLETGSGCCTRYGTMAEAHSAAYSAISACVSILVNLPINYPHDGDAILETLAYTGWRRLPTRGRQRAAERFARFVAARIMARGIFKPIA